MHGITSSYALERNEYYQLPGFHLQPTRRSLCASCGSMRHHWRVLALVCAFSGLVAFKPSEPFLVVFLRCVKQLSRHEIFKEVYPVLPPSPARLRRTRQRLSRLAPWRRCGPTRTSASSQRSPRLQSSSGTGGLCCSVCSVGWPRWPCSSPRRPTARCL